MSTVGSGFGSLLKSQMVQRVMKNPIDKSTVVSVYPREIVEVKHTIFPGRFVIPAAPEGSFSTLVVGSSSWFREIDEDTPVIEIPVSSVEIAKAIITDYSNGLAGCNMFDKMPGLFYLLGEWSHEKIKKEAVAELKAAEEKQLNWFKQLVVIADTLWSRTNGNPLSISDDARFAANKLNLKNKPWMGDFRSAALNNCPACGHMVNFNFPVCSNCKAVINKEKFQELNLRFAE